MGNAFENKKKNQQRNLFFELFFFVLLERKILRAKDILWDLWIENLDCYS